MDDRSCFTISFKMYNLTSTELHVLKARAEPEQKTQNRER